MGLGFLVFGALLAVLLLVISRAPDIREFSDASIDSEVEMADGFCETDCIYRDEKRRRAGEEA